MLAVRTNNLFLALLVKIKVLVAYALSKNYVVLYTTNNFKFQHLFIYNNNHRISFFNYFSILIISKNKGFLYSLLVVSELFGIKNIKISLKITVFSMCYTNTQLVKFFNFLFLIST